MMFRNGLNHKFWILLYCLLTFSLITACGTTSSKNIADSTSIKTDENILRVGVSASAPPLIYKQGEKEVAEFLKLKAKKGDIIFTLGAGDIFNWHSSIAKAIEGD